MGDEAERRDADGDDEQQPPRQAEHSSSTLPAVRTEGNRLLRPLASGPGAAELDAADGLAGQLAGRVDDLAHQSSGDQSQRDVAAFPQLEQQRVVSQAPEATER